MKDKTTENKNKEEITRNDTTLKEKMVSKSNIEIQSINQDTIVENTNEKNDIQSIMINDEAIKNTLLQPDYSFSIKVESQGLDSFELAVSTLELVQEIFQVLIDREDTCHRTCFSLQLNGVILDNFAELKNIDGLKEGSVIKVVEEPYTVREARIHVRHVRDLLKSINNHDAYQGADCNSLSYLNIITAGDILDKKSSRPDCMDCTPPEYIMPGSTERPLTPLHPCESKTQECLKVMTYSGWNPPPSNRKMHGDLLYLYIVTNEGKHYHITSSTRGFYINKSTQDEFNPKPVSPKLLNHSLIDILGQISVSFKRNFQALLKKRSQKHPFERVSTPYQLYSWMVPPVEHNIDSIRAEDAFSSRLGYEEHIPGQTRDWNEELQTTRELPKTTLPERLIRERAIFKVHSDFVVAATRGAVAVIEGNIMAINPGEDSKMQMYLWNNIFFSLGFDIKDHYKDFGGDAAAYSAPGSDLQGVKMYSTVESSKLYTLGTVVIDYRGYRVTAQSIIPGILEREQEHSVVYGSIDFGKSVVTCDAYKELLAKTTKSLKIQSHSVINDEGKAIELHSSVECKGIIGNDGRHYVLDLLRTFPPDINYIKDCGEILSDEMVSLGYPKTHCHRLVCLRKELIDAFIENRYITFVRHAASLFQQWRIQKLQDKKSDENQNGEIKTLEQILNGNTENNVSNTENNVSNTDANGGESSKENADDPEIEKSELTPPSNNDDVKKLMESISGQNSSYEESSNDIMKKATEAVGSLSETEFLIAFNPDLFQPHVKHVDPESEEIKKGQKLIKDACEFLVVNQIPNFINECLKYDSWPLDGHALSTTLHHNGINIRYLGQVTSMVTKHPTLTYLKTICISELICRATKHIFKTYIQAVDMTCMSQSVAHFLNCFIGSLSTPHSDIMVDELQSQKARKKNKKKSKIPQDMSWTNELPKTLWKKIFNEVETYYDYKVESEQTIDSIQEKFKIQRVSLLRRICKSVGIQLLLKDYQLDSRNKQIFQEEDIVSLYPIVKNIHPRATDAYKIFTSGQANIQQGQLVIGFDLINEALNLLNNVYGALHVEIEACTHLLARLNYIMGDYPEALIFQQRAVLMSERVHGIDSSNTITEYSHLALYCFANNQVSTALKLMYRARYLALICHGENHPQIALFDSNIGLILHAVGEFELGLKFLKNALELNIKFFSDKSLTVATSYHLLSKTYACISDYKSAFLNEKTACSIYEDLLGVNHERSKESMHFLKQLTTQAVQLQRAMNQITKGETLTHLPPTNTQAPTMASVLDTLNLINGIVFVHVSQSDIEKFREEMINRHKTTISENVE